MRCPLHIPTTSKTLLRTLGENARSARWTEFVARSREARRDEAARREAEAMTDPAMAAASPDRICAEHEKEAWRKAAFEIALRQLLADDAIQERTKQVFVRVAVRGEATGDVAKAFGISPNTVSQIRFRLTQRLRNTVEALENAE